MNMEKILVINPNSTEVVTRGIDEACAPLRMAGGPAIDCVTLKEGPPGIETQQHVDGVVAPMLRLVREKDAEYAAFVIACSMSSVMLSVPRQTLTPASRILAIGAVCGPRRELFAAQCAMCTPWRASSATSSSVQ